MRIRNILSFNRKLQLLQLSAHITFIYALIYQFSFWGLLSGYLMWFMTKIIGSEAGSHRYFTHKAYKTSKKKEWFLLFWHFFCGDGSMLAFIGVHRTHHANAETERDPHSPRYKSWFQITYWTDPITIQPKYVRDWIKDPAIQFTHKYYFLIHFLMLFAFLISGNIVLYGYIFGMSMVMNWYTDMVINWVCHNRNLGYRNFDTPDDSVNSKIFMWLGYGIALHNNHHAIPNAIRNNVKENEYDASGWIIERFFVES